MTQANLVIRPFLFEDEHVVRTVEMNDGETWFVGVDLCRVLGIGDHKRTLGGLDDDERAWKDIQPMADARGPDAPRGPDTPPRSDRELRRTIVISEPAVYRLVFASKKPVAKRFKRWLAHEVLPTLRKTGSYTTPHAAAAPQPEKQAFPDWPLDEMRTKRGVIDMYRMLYGNMAGQWVMPQLGFPVPPIEVVDRGRQFSLILIETVNPPGSGESGPGGTTR